MKQEQNKLEQSHCSPGLEVVIGSVIRYLVGCEDDLAATSVTPLIARVDWADLAG